ncbi:MAG: hypothetical protein CME62_14045 [Halobacteriovoraceae bacterium]|nr:hypothetical protein [Halobacteriovoraceae bacterium]|tara:strand:- start:1243 stop:1899 length:657 start_codon:yes stop_codon:yes gene_type:complete
MKFLLSFILLVGTQAGLAAKEFKNATDGEYITVSGKVEKASGKMFHLKSENKKIKVTMDNHFDTWAADGFKVREGDKVVVTGRVDKDLLDNDSLNAGSVYVQNLGTYFYGDSSDKSQTPKLSSSYLSIQDLPENTSVDITGTVSNVSGREFTVNTGTRRIQVDTAGMAYNPMDNVGLTQIKEGDRVTVSGVVDDKYLDEKELAPGYIIELPENSTYSE